MKGNYGAVTCGSRATTLGLSRSIISCLEKLEEKARGKWREDYASALREKSCGFARSVIISLSFMEEVRTHEQGIEFRDSAVEAERVIPGAREWDRHKLYNAANLYYFRTAWDSERQRKYKVARVGGCVMYDADRLRDVGAFNFWKHPPPEYSGEDVLAQLHLLKRYGGFGIIPSGVYHQELPTTVQDRRFDLPKLVYSKGIKPRSLYGRDWSAAG